MPQAQSKKSVIKKVTNGKASWYHVNPTENKLVLRQIPDYDTEPWDKENPLPLPVEVEEQFLFKDATEKTGLPVGSLSVEEPEAWTFLVRRLERIAKKADKTSVPVTRLRRFYRALRDFGDVLRQELASQMHLAMSQSFAEDSCTLAKLCNESFEHFKRYTPKDPYLPERRPDYESAKGRPLESTKELVAAIQKKDKPILVEGAPELSFHYVERELSPLRTKKGVLETGEPASKTGTGGADLLLQNAHDKTPIVGEIKIWKDTTLFLGLVQALTYALEFSTPEQIGRLASTFPEFAGLGETTRVDVYLVSAKPPPEKPYTEITKGVETIAKSLCDNKRIHFLRRIVYLEATLAEDRTIRFEKKFAFGL